MRDEDAATLAARLRVAERPARLLRLEAGVARFRAQRRAPGGPAARDAARCRTRRRGLGALPARAAVVCVQTIVRDYLSPADRERYELGMRELLLRRGRRARCTGPELELDPSGELLDRLGRDSRRASSRAGALRELRLARTHPHPRQLFVDEASVVALPPTGLSATSS